MSLAFRKCTLEDLEVLRDFSSKTYYETFKHSCTPDDMDAYLSEAFEIDKIRAELLDEGSDFYFLYRNDELAGYLKLNEAPAQTEIHDEMSLEIERIYISEEYQGLGLGRDLLARAINIATSRKKEYVWLGVWENNDKALLFYKKNDFFTKIVSLSVL